MRHPAKDPLTQSAVPVPAGHDQVGFLGAHKLEKLGRDRASGALPGFVSHNDTVAHEVACDVGKGFSVKGFRFFFTDSDHKNFLGFPEERKRVLHRAPALTGVLASYYDATKLQGSNDVGHHQDRPAGPQQNNAGLDQITHLATGSRLPDQDDVRRPGLSCNELGW